MAKASFTIQIKGQDALNKAFNALPVQLQRKALRPALRAGAKVMRTFVQAEARATFTKSDSPAPHVADTLKIKAMKRDRSKRGRIGLVVITAKREVLGVADNLTGYYPANIEYGYLAGPRVQGPVDIDEDRRGKEGAKPSQKAKAALQSGRRHIPANPWMKRGLESGRSASEAAIAEELKRRMKALAGPGAAGISDAEFFDDLGPDESADIF